MKRLILICALCATISAVAGVSAPRWAGDHPNSLINIVKDPALAAKYISKMEWSNARGILSAEGKVRLAEDKAELAAYQEYARQQANK